MALTVLLDNISNIVRFPCLLEFPSCHKVFDLPDGSYRIPMSFSEPENTARNFSYLVNCRPDRCFLPPSYILFKTKLWYILRHATSSNILYGISRDQLREGVSCVLIAALIIKKSFIYLSIYIFFCLYHSIINQMSIWWNC